MKQQDKQNLLYPQFRYHGKFTPQALVFNANLQEFTTKVSYISNLETAGKISSQEAYQQIKNLWKQLEFSYSTLEIGKDNIS
ncbi:MULTISPECIES: DUF7219 family protein [Nostocales]|uniref:Isopropylmalate/homocitrate/citramalate synthase n=3 Tax=Nostocales TaxID=1161 RepID=A0A0C1R421_9CYAN|nr:hypothetical protein [Tolypothrix bouteillei]KAF3889540.1 hypothetical protein DA73_0400031735 [Tolypothrix bouteillei VB521301]